LNDPDVLVIGAGIMGVASAYHIKKSSPGKEVVVVDRYGAPGQGNTGRSNAMFRNTFSSRDNQVLSDSSISFYQHAQSEGEDLGLQAIGYLWLMSEEQVDASEPYLSSMARNGIEVRRFGRSDLESRLPGLVLDGDREGQAELLGLPRISEGVFGPKCGRLDPDKLVRYYVRLFTDLGGKMLMGTEVKEIIVGPRESIGVDGEPFVWQDSRVVGVKMQGRAQGTVSPETVVVACGAWDNELLEPIGVDGHVKAKKRQLFSVQAKGDQGLEGLVMTKGFNSFGLVPMVILPKSGVHFKPVNEEMAIWTSCEDEVNRPYIDIPGKDLDEYRAEPEYFEKGIKPVLTAYFPAFGRAKMKAMWAGLYGYNTSDYLPFVFRGDNLIVMGGDSGSGIMKGDSLGRVVDAVYRQEEEAILFGDVPYRASKLSFDRRDVEREEWVI
jgi:FAD-dependent oxidoreductase domain-containing protein 1